MVETPRQYDIRPQPRTVADTALEGCFRVFMSQDAMMKEKIKQGDWILMSRVEVVQANGTLQTSVRSDGGLGIAWKFQDTNTKKDCIKIHDALRSLYGFELKDKLVVFKYQGELKRAQKVIVLEVTEDGKPIVSKEPREDLTYAAANALFNLEAIECGLTFEASPRIATRRGRKRKFLIDTVLPEPPGPGQPDNVPFAIPFYFDRHSTVEIRDALTTPSDNLVPGSFTIHADFTGLFGLDSQLEQLKLALGAISKVHSQNRPYPKLNASWPILIQGPPGSGKSTLLKRLEDAAWARHFHVRPSLFSGSMEKVESACAKLFIEAKALEPSLIAIDDIDRIASVAEHHTLISELLAEQLEALHDSRVLVVATTRKFFDINDRVQRCFDKILELPIPNETGRCDILRDLTGNTLPDQVIQMVAEHTPAFIARDLQRLCRVAFDEASRRAESSTVTLAVSQDDSSRTIISESHDSSATSAEATSPKIDLLAEDFEIAIGRVHPSVMTEAYIEVPKVRWSDIKGSEQVKRKLDDILGFPIRYPELVTKFRLEPTMGILLYGPPGCSKTLTAKAVATEYGRNFIAVQGPELISKYVGESEYKIREVFRKARAAAPSVIFFDEIDSIAPRRDKSGHEGLQTVTTLLNEMDGIQGSKGVLVLAATNRPDSIDPALLRPRRLGTMIYTGPPNFEARQQIIAMKNEGRDPEAYMNTSELAEITDGFSGADVVELCELAAAEAAKEQASNLHQSVQLRMDHFEAAFKEMKPTLTAEVIEKLKNWSVGA